MAEEIRVNLLDEPAQSTVVQMAFIPPSTLPNNSIVFGASEYIALLDENSPSGTVLELPQATFSVGSNGALQLSLENDNGNFNQQNVWKHLFL